MLDIRRIRQNPEEIAQLLAKKGVVLDLGQVQKLDEDRRQILGQIEALKAERNQNSEKVSTKKKRGEDATDLIELTRQVGDRIRELEASIAPLDEELRRFLLTVPNTPLPEVPNGSTAEDNLELHRVGSVPAFSYTPEPHWDLGEKLGILDFERARKITGARFTVFKGAGARLTRALANYMLDHARQRGYLEVVPPYLVNYDSMVGTGQFPKFIDDAFAVDDHRYYLIPTAEVPLTNLHREEILSWDELPLKYCAYTPSFRAEAGAAGRDTRGVIRQHQFDKVELVRIVSPETSSEAMDAMLRDAETLLEELDLAYRTVLLCGGDMGFGQAKTYDIEVWMPSYNRYVEISSVSNMTDFQARRSDMRYRPAGSKKTEFVHTLNGSALAIGRTVAAIMENFQTSTGRVRIPQVLKPYMAPLEEI